MKRLTSIDFWRGIAIFFTAIFHFLFTSWDKFADTGAILTGSIGFLILAIFIFVLIHWRGFFLMISSIANFYQMESGAKNGKNIWGIFGKQIFAGFILILVGKLWVTVFPYWGFLEIWSRQNPIGSVPIQALWMDHWDMFFLIEAIESIGLMMIITAFFFLGFQFFKGKNAWIIKLVICYVVGFAIIIISPYVGQWVADSLGVTYYEFSNAEAFRYYLLAPGYFRDNIANLGDFFGQFGYIMKRTALNWIAGREAPLFPMLGSYFIGAGIAYVVLQDKPKKKHLRWLLLPSLLALILGALDLFFLYEYVDGSSVIHTGIDAMFANIGFHVHPRWFALVSLGLQAPLLLATFSWVEFNPKINERKWLQGTRWIRRFGTFTLTVYFLGIFDFVLRFLMSVIVPEVPGADFLTRYGLGTMWTVITVAILMGLWIGGLYLWDRVAKGYGSFEFFLSLLKIPKAGRKRDWKDPIGLKASLWDVEMISFVK
jgi:hypothetical protein